MERRKHGGIRYPRRVSEERRWRGLRGSEIKIDSACKEPKIIICTEKITDQVNELVKKLSGEPPRIISGFRGETFCVLEQGEILRVYASEGKVFAVTPEGEYTLRLRLYEMEERLDRDRFIRISNSEIINLKKVKRFDLSFTGTICVSLSDGTVTYVSRRYVSRIKHALGL